MPPNQAAPPVRMPSSTIAASSSVRMPTEVAKLKRRSSEPASTLTLPSSTSRNCSANSS